MNTESLKGITVEESASEFNTDNTAEPPSPDFAVVIPHWPVQDGRLNAATEHTVTVTYEEESGKPAGAAVSLASSCPFSEATLNTSHDNKEEENLFFPFKNEEDYGLAMWFHEAKLTKGDVTAFFREPLLQNITDRLSFRSAAEWRAKLDGITQGLPLDNWVRDRVTIDSNIQGEPAKQYTFYYQDILPVITFLLGHKNFSKDLTYAPVRVFNQRQQRIYTEIHTADWWWNTQGKLEDGATVVPLLLGVDKTVLTQHHGDVSAWPIYLTIGNLNSRLRRKQTQPSLILVGFLPIVKNESRVIKGVVYHKVLETIFRCE
ncbi:hypothetical protein GX50_09028 [[Emmonsia] crescens]|uniref:Uncharacterized protein n=1 Tax=[Emmonsia] crescens TaxID=73230 RepID=A0A2B7XS60_9EURO|nr:hypothetical protein GX50_09028 [Emmonsia crescens]